MILDVLTVILVLCLVVFVIAATFALVFIALCLYKYNVKDIVYNFNNNKGD